MKVIVVGDIHGEFGKLNTFINKQKPDVLIQAGDNAYYWGKAEDNVGKIKPQNTKVYLVPGNHSNYNILEEVIGRYGKSPVEVEPNIFICPIGSSIILNGQTILFVGGAESSDKQYRVKDVTWWEQEKLTIDDYTYIEETVRRADVIISHTCPTYFPMNRYHDRTKLNDHSRKILDSVHDLCKPKLWFFGHYHEFTYGHYEKCSWVGLNMIGESNWWKYLII